MRFCRLLLLPLALTLVAAVPVGAHGRNDDGRGKHASHVEHVTHAKHAKGAKHAKHAKHSKHRHKPGKPQRSEVYPTDRCVATKLEAAARYCAAALGAQGLPDHDHKGKGRKKGHHVSLKERALDRARRALRQDWARAEAKSEAAGVSCAETTVDADEMIALLDEGAAALAEEVEGSKVCRARRVSSAAATCQALLDAEAKHLLERSQDRERRRLERRRAEALHRLATTWNAGCGKHDRESAPREAVSELAQQAFLAAVVSPVVSTEWTMIDPPDQVPYQGGLRDEVLEPICSRGTPWVFFVKRGTVNKLLVYFQGGGACWNAFTCGVLPTFKQTTGPDDNPANFASGFADLSNPENPFRDWHAVFVPYCTGDVHWGDAVVEHAPDGTATIHHKGRVNAAVAEKWAREHFVHPEQVFVTGSSAGSYGAVVNAIALQEFAYPSTPFAVLGDGGNGVITRDFLENDLAKWGIEKNLPRWIPGLDRPLTELSAADLWTEAAQFYRHSRWANYTTAYDGGTGGQVGFYNIMLNPDNIAQWLNWWVPSCEWNEEMRALVQESAALAPDNYRYYIGTGSRHTMWSHNKVYTDTTGGVPTIVSWVSAMLAGSPDWVNVECEDCGRLLPGDPRPIPPQPPYVEDPDTGEVRIVCE